jgi:hypothetical protein
VAHIEALDAQRRIFKAECLLYASKRVCASCEVGASSSLIKRQSVLRVLHCRFLQRSLIATLRNPDVNF